MLEQLTHIRDSLKAIDKTRLITFEEGYMLMEIEKVLESFKSVHRLSQKELGVFRLLGEGKDVHEIAKALGITRKTVENHRDSCCRKLGIKRAYDLRFAAFKFVHSGDLERG